MQSYINDSAHVNIHTQLDSKLSNVTTFGPSVTIETIGDYLDRVLADTDRFLGVPVTILLPKLSYIGSLTFSVLDYNNIIGNFETKYYAFIDGVANENFKEIIETEEITFSDTDDIDLTYLTGDVSGVTIGYTGEFIDKNDRLATVSNGLIKSINDGSYTLTVINGTIDDVIVPPEPEPTTTFPVFLEDREWGFADLVIGTSQVYDIDLYAAWDYKILYFILKSNINSFQVDFKLNGNDMLDGIQANPQYSPFYTDPEIMIYEGDTITAHINNSNYSGNPTYFGGKIVTQRVPRPEAYIIISLNIPNGGAEVVFYTDLSKKFKADWENNGNTETIIPSYGTYSHTYTAGLHTSKIYVSDLNWDNNAEYVTEIVDFYYPVGISAYSSLITSFNVNNSIVLKNLDFSYSTSLTTFSLTGCYRLEYLNLIQTLLDSTTLDNILTELTNSLYSRLKYVDLTVLNGIYGNTTLENAFRAAHPDCTLQTNS